MSINAATVLQVQNDGNNENGGGFYAARDAINGVDYTQQAAPQLDLTDLACSAGTPTVLTSATGGFTHAMEGNLIQIHAGTNFTVGFYEVVTYTNTNTVTLDRTPISGGDGSSGHGKLGGGFADIGKLGAALTSIGEFSLVCFLKGNITITSASTNVTGGCLSTDKRPLIYGYATTRTIVNTDTKPVLTIDAGVSTSVMFNAGSGGMIYNLSLDGAGNTSSRGSTAIAVRCHFANFTNSGSASYAVFCSATGCSTAYAMNASFFSEAYDNTVSGFSGSPCVFCIADSNTGASSDGFSSCQIGICNVAYANGRDGFSHTDASQFGVRVNCIAEGNGRYGYNQGGPAIFYNNSGYNNSSGNSIATLVTNIGYIAITDGSPFTDATNGDFSLNNTANRGALLRAAGFPQTFLRGLTASKLDIGASQHADPVGGGRPELRGGNL